MRLLVIEDDEAVARSLQKALRGALHSVDVALTGRDGVRLALGNSYDLLVLDYYLPDMNGRDIAGLIKGAKPNLPIIALSNEPKVLIKVEMLSVCDDYIVKPFSFEELTARIQAVSRRTPMVLSPVLSFDGLEVIVDSFEAKCDGKLLPLSVKEFMLLRYLMENDNRVLSRNLILEKVWDMNVDTFTNTVDVHIQRIRSKIGRRGKKFIVTVPGVGYKFVGNK